MSRRNLFISSAVLLVVFLLAIRFYSGFSNQSSSNSNNVSSYDKAATWSKTEASIIQSLSLSKLSAPPASASNRYANNSKVAALGKQLFFDPRFSANGKISCASCHQPDRYFTDGLVKGAGIAGTSRNTPTIIGGAWQRWFYWDGRRDSLWSQALIPFEAHNEMGSSRLDIIRKVYEIKTYREQYETLFGTLPELALDTLPENASPLGSREFQDAWYRLPKTTQKHINKLFANMGKAIAAYERTLKPTRTRFDDYADNLNTTLQEGESLNKSEIAGLRLFIDSNKTQCLQCHNGPLMTNGGFHNIGTGTFKGENLDFGRAFGLQSAMIDEFNCIGVYSDANRDDCSQLRFLSNDQHIPMQGAFKVPSLRGTAITAPYFHDGRFTTLREVIEFYNEPPLRNGGHELKALKLTESEIQDLTAFMQVFNQ